MPTLALRFVARRRWDLVRRAARPALRRALPALLALALLAGAFALAAYLDARNPPPMGEHAAPAP